MKRLGVFLLAIGLLSYIAPLLGMQFRLISLFGGGPWVGAAFIGVGAVLFAISSAFSSTARPSRSSVPQAPPRPSPAVAAPARPAPAGEGNFCGQCRRLLPRGALYCPVCGAAVARTMTPISVRPTTPITPVVAPRPRRSRGPAVALLLLFCLAIVVAIAIYRSQAGGWKGITGLASSPTATIATSGTIPPPMATVPPAPRLGTAARATVDRVWLEPYVVVNDAVGTNVHVQVSNPGGAAAFCCIYVREPKGSILSADPRLKDSAGNLALVAPMPSGTGNVAGTHVSVFLPNAAFPLGVEAFLLLQPVLYDSQWHEMTRSGNVVTFSRDVAYLTRITAVRSASAQPIGRPGLEITADLVCSPLQGRSGKVVAHFFPAVGARPLPGFAPYADSAGNLYGAADFVSPRSEAHITGVKLAVPIEMLNGMPVVQASVSLFDTATMQYIGRPVWVDVKLTQR